jgi:hypothetical protein
LGDDVVLLRLGHAQEAIANLCLQRVANPGEIHARGQRIEIADAQRFAEAPNGIIRRRRIEQKQRGQA